MNFNRTLASKRKEFDYDKYKPTIKDPFENPQEFVNKINYEGQEAISNIAREYYSTTEDPSSYMALHDLTKMFKLANPEMGEKYIETHTKEILEAYVGQDLDYKGAFQEAKSAYISANNELKTSAKYIDLFANNKDALDSEEFANKLQELNDYVDNQPLGKRSDYLKLNLMADMLVATGNILPSSLPSMAMYGLGGIVNIAAPGVGTGIARIASSAYAGYQEAGGAIKNLVQQRDSEGNKLSNEAIWSMSQWIMAGVFGLNMVFDPAQRTMGKATELLGKKIFQKGVVSSIIKSGSSSLLKPIAMGAGRLTFDSLVEGIQEVGEDIVSLAAERVGITKYNQLNDTDFTTATFEEAKKQLANTFTQTVKGMPLMGAFGNAVVTSQKILGKESSIRRDANKVSGFTKDSQVISPSSIVIPKSVKGMDTFKESAGPIEVVKVGDNYIPTNAKDASFFASVKEKNTKGVNVVVQNQTGESTATASVFAENIADKLALGWKDNAVVYESAKDAKKAAEKFAINSQGRVTGYTETDGVYTVSLESNGEIHDIVFTHKNNITDYTKSEVREDSKPTPTNTEQTTNNAKDIKAVARKFNTADSKKVQKQIKKAMPSLSPNENKIAAAMFGMMSEAQDMTIDEFLEANYKNGEIFGSAKDGDLKGFRGYVEFGDDLKAVIYAAEHSDFSTFSHETFHVAFRSLGKQAEFSQIIQDAAATEEFHTWVSEHGQLFEDNVFKDVNLSEFAKTFMDSEWSNTHEEFLARVFEGYLSDGKSLSPKLKPLLAIIADWFKEIYHSIKHTVDLDSRIVEAFDSMLDKDTKLQAEVRGEATADTTEETTVLHQGTINSLNQVPSWQRSQVEKVYKNNKRFMKDLYGNKTNMTEFDWIGTRTNNFRLWFGDWLDEKTEDVSQVQEENGDPRVMFIPSKTGVGVEEPGYEVTANGSMVEVSFFPKHASETAMEMEADTVSYRTYNEMVDYKWEMKAKHSTQLIADYFGGFLDDEKVDKDKLMKQMEGVSWKVGLEMVKKYGVPDVNEALKSEGAGVMPVYVNARNLFIPSVMFDSILAEFLWKYDQEQMSNEKAVEDFKKGYSEKYRDETIIDYLKEVGFDGILMQDNYYNDSASIGVFHMSQIKSTFNDGAFDSESTDILHQPELKPLSKNSKEYKETKKRVQDMLENKEYPKDHELALFKGEEWADKEISFRRLYAQDDMLVSKFEEAYDAYIDEITSYDEKTGEEVVTPAENENKRILEILHEQDRATFDNIEDSIGDTESFIGRMKQQIELMTPKVADQGFKAALSDDSFVLEVASMLTGDLDPTQDSGISKYLFRLANDENPSGHTLRYARKALIDNVREYRRMIYEMDGETAQLSYERAIEGTEIGEGVDSLGVSNTEVKNLLNSDLSEEIKAMIEENIATDTTLTAIIEDNLSKATSIDNKNRSIKAMSDNIAEINERIAEITAELEQQADETASLDEGRAETLQKLKDKSQALSRAKADLKRVKIARDALKTKAAIKKITSKLDVHAKDSVNTADARMTSLMQKFLSILRTPNPKGIDYRVLLKNIGVEFDTLPGILKSYFVASDDVLLLKSTLSNMSIDEIIQLEKDMKEMKAAARHLLTERKEKSRSASNWVKTEFYSQRTGKKFATVEDYHDYVDNLKYESGPKTSKSKESQKWLIKSMFETNLLTGSRWLRRIDGKVDGAVSKWIFGGELEDGTVWKGVEGVIDQELKRSNERYQKAAELMKKEGLTDKHMIGKFEINGEPVVMRGQTITNQRAIAVYIYDQQKKGKVLLRNLDGNGFTNSEVKKIIDNLTESQKKLGDFMIEDFASVRGEVEETYYKVNNKILGWEDNYFPLVGTGDNARFSSVLESNQGKPSSDPRHTFTEKRTGEVYKLNLDVVTSWASMVKQQEHYIAGAEFFSQTQQLMNKHGGDLYSAISETKGPVYAAKLQEFIDGLADHKTALDEADSAINAVRNNLIVARLGFNVITALKQIPSFGAFAMEYGPIELAKAFIQVGTNYKGSMELINEMAPQIKYRSFTSEYQALMNMQGTSQYKLAKKGFAQFSMRLITAMDMAVVNTLWIGSYNNSIAHNLSPEMAAMKATKFINDTQPTGNFKDNSMIYSSNSPIWKFLLMFTNQLNKYLNIAYDIPFELKEHMFHQAIGSIVSLGINTAGIVLLSGGMLRADGDDDDEYWKSVLGEIQGTMLSVVPVVGPLVAPIVMNQYFPDTSMPMVSELAQLWSANKVEDPEKRKESIEKALINMGFAGAEVGGFAAAGAGKKIYKSLTKENMWYLLNSAYGDRMGDL